jgi:hypothetical protein
VDTSYIIHTKIKKYCASPSLLCSRSQKSIFGKNPYENDLSAEHENILNHNSFLMPTDVDIFNLSLPGRMERQDILEDIVRTGRKGQNLAMFARHQWKNY